MNWPQLLIRLAATRAANRQQNRRKGVLGITAGLASVGALAVIVALSAVAAATMRGPASAGATATGIPSLVFAAYLAAEKNAHTISPGCEVDWPVVAGIWKAESGHATSGGATVDETGQVAPPIYGVLLDGSAPGTAVVADTDDGVIDGNTFWDRAVGPAQFLPASWWAHGQDGNDDSLADPHNVYDAALSTVAYLCQRTPGDYHDPARLSRAIRGYNNSAEYVEMVTGWISHYRAFAINGGGMVTADGLYAFPLPHESVTVEELRRSHHDYPASDLMVPEGTPVYAAHPGIIANLYQPCPDCKCGYGVTVAGIDEHRYTFCHGQALVPQLEVGADVVVGQMLMLSGNTGNSTTPHLHFQIRNPTGDLVCPQPLLESWWTGTALASHAAPTDGCTH